MCSNKITIVLIADDDPINKAINVSLLKGLSVVKEIIQCKNAMEALNFIIKIKKEYDPAPNLVLLDLKKSAMTGNKFLEFFNYLDNPKKKECSVTVLYTPDFSKGISKETSSGFVVVEKPITEFKNDLVSDFYDNLHLVTFPGIDIIEKPQEEQKGHDTFNHLSDLRGKENS